MALYNPALYQYRRNDALAAWNDAKLRIGRRRQNVLQEYGYSASFDDKGNLVNMQIDPTSQYGRFQKMMKGHASMLQQAEDSSIERGLGAGTAGLGAQAHSEARYQQGSEQETMGRELSSTFADLSEAQTDEERRYNTTLAELDAAEARDKWEQQEFDRRAAQDAADREAARQAAEQGSGTDLGDLMEELTGRGGGDGSIVGNRVRVGPRGQLMNAAQLKAHIRRTGGSLARWKRNHPAAARALGI